MVENLSWETLCGSQSWLQAAFQAALEMYAIHDVQSTAKWGWLQPSEGFSPTFFGFGFAYTGGRC
jgi:hypothetical protein